MLENLLYQLPCRRIAAHWLGIFLKRWEGNLPSWRKAILVTRARFLATHVRDSAWGKRARRAKINKWRNRVHGNPSPILKGEGWKLWDAAKRKRKRQADAELGLEPTRIAMGNLDGI